MKNFLKKYGLFIVQGLVMLIMAWNGFFAQDTGHVSTVKSHLAEENLRLNTAIEKSRQNETKLRQEMVVKEGIITQLDKNLTATMGSYEALKVQLAKASKPQDAASFLELKECQEKYAELVSSFNLCLAANEKGDFAMDLTVEKMSTQNEIIKIHELSYLECQQQVVFTEEKLNETESALAKLEKIYKRKLFQKNTIIYAVSIAAGIVTGYFLLKKK